VTSPGVVTNGVAVAAGDPAGVVCALGATDVGLAAADAAALGALVGVVGLAVGLEPPHAVTNRADVMRSAAVLRRAKARDSNIAAFPVVSTNLLDLVERLDAMGEAVK